MLNVIGRDMPLDMMHSYQRDILRPGNRLCLGNSHQKSTHQPRTISDTDRVQIVQRDPCFLQCHPDHLVYFLNVLSGCKFRNHTSIKRVQINLRRNDIGKHRASVFHHRSSSFVTGTFNSQY